MKNPLTGRLFLVLALAALGPLASPRGALADPVAVHYAIPVEAPTGEVQVLSFGLAALPMGGLFDRKRFVHLRLAAYNQADDTPWVLDAREQTLLLPDGRRVAARFAETSAAVEPALIALRRGQHGYLDLFFALEGRDPEQASLAWTVRRAGLATVAITAFQRLSPGESSYEYYGPSHHPGGSMIIGATWCMPDRWSSRWLHPYSRYGSYRHHRRRGRLEVAHEGRVWQADERPTPSRGSVGARWRRAETAGTQRPVTEERARRSIVGSGAPPDPTSRGGSVGRSWRNSSDSSTRSSAASESRSRSQSSESSGSSRGSSSGSPSGDAPSQDSSSPSASRSVGRSWRSAR